MNRKLANTRTCPGATSGFNLRYKSSKDNEVFSEKRVLGRPSLHHKKKPTIPLPDLSSIHFDAG